MKYTNEQIISAAKNCGNKDEAAIDVMVRPEAKYALKNSIPLAMLVRFLEQLEKESSDQMVYSKDVNVKQENCLLDGYEGEIVAKFPSL